MSLLDPVQYPGAIKAFAKEVCRNDLLNFGRLHFFFPDSRLSLDLNTDKTLKVGSCPLEQSDAGRLVLRWRPLSRPVLTAMLWHCLLALGNRGARNAQGQICIVSLLRKDIMHDAMKHC